MQEEGQSNEYNQTNNLFLKFDYQPITTERNSQQLVWSEMVKWLIHRFKSERSKVKLIDSVEEYYANPKNPNITNYWIGFIHQPPNLPSNYLSVNRLLNNPKFRIDLDNCLGLWVFSPYLKEILEERLTLKPVVIHQCYYFITEIPNQFSMSDFHNNFNPHLVFVGWRNRRFDRFYQVDSPYPKSWLSVKDPEEALGHLTEHLSEEWKIIYEPDQPIMIQQINTEQYGKILQQNIIIIDYYDCSASNTLLECIMRGTPVFVNPVGGVIDYLGRRYPLYFDSVSELETKLNDLELIKSAHKYLLALDKSLFTPSQFEATVKDPDLVSNVSKLNQNYLGISKFNQQFASKRGLKSLSKTNPIGNKLSFGLSGAVKPNAIDINQQKKFSSKSVPLVKSKPQPKKSIISMIAKKPPPKKVAEESKAQNKE